MSVVSSKYEVALVAALGVYVVGTPVSSNSNHVVSDVWLSVVVSGPGHWTTHCPLTPYRLGAEHHSTMDVAKSLEQLQGAAEPVA